MFYSRDYSERNILCVCVSSFKIVSVWHFLMYLLPYLNQKSEHDILDAHRVRLFGGSYLRKYIWKFLCTIF